MDDFLRGLGGGAGGRIGGRWGTRFDVAGFDVSGPCAGFVAETVDRALVRADVESSPSRGHRMGDAVHRGRPRDFFRCAIEDRDLAVRAQQGRVAGHDERFDLAVRGDGPPVLHHRRVLQRYHFLLARDLGLALEIVRLSDQGGREHLGPFGSDESIGCDRDNLMIVLVQLSRQFAPVLPGDLPPSPLADFVIGEACGRIEGVASAEADRLGGDHVAAARAPRRFSPVAAGVVDLEDSELIVILCRAEAAAT